MLFWSNLSRVSKFSRTFSPVRGVIKAVQYALEAVRKGSSVVGVRGTDTIIIATEKRSVPPLQNPRTEKKMAKLDKHVLLAFSGLRADARVIISRARIECQAYQMSVDDSVSVEYITKYIGGLQQLYTQSNGRRPFGVSCIIGGFDYQDNMPRLFQTEPSGITYEWKAAAMGRNDTLIRAFLEKNYANNTTSEYGCIRLALQALVEHAPNSRVLNYDLAIIKPGHISMMPASDIASVVSDIQKKKQSSIGPLPDKTPEEQKEKNIMGLNKNMYG